MPGKPTVVKVQENVPVFGTPKYADVVESRIDGSPQLKLNGRFDGVEGYGVVYLHDACNAQMRALGILGDKEDGTGPKIIGTPRIKILRADGRTTITLATGAAPATNGTANHAPTNGHAPAHPQNNAAERPGETFKRLKITLAACIKASRAAWAESLPAGEVAPFESVTATAHTLFIAADRRNCLSPLPPKPVGPITDAQKADIDAVSKQLATRHAWTRERLSSEILGATQAPELAKLTEPQAKIAIAFLQDKLRELDQNAAIASTEAALRAGATAAPDEEIPW